LGKNWLISCCSPLIALEIGSISISAIVHCFWLSATGFLGHPTLCTWHHCD
jgi:hypothetical protein